VVEVVIGLATAVLMTLLRIALMPLTGDRAPYSLVFVGVLLAAVLAGWRSGLLALLFGQLFAWFMVVDPASYAAQKWNYIGGLAVATFAQLAVLAIVALYQREVARSSSRLASERDLLGKALREIDHRTSNNYQTVLALVLAQATAAKEASVKDALRQVADRIRAIANASRKLAVASESLEQVRIGDHLQDLCGDIERGLSRDGIHIDCDFDDMVLSADRTVSVSILVNELVTNALKHAFPDGRSGTIAVSLKRTVNGIDLVVADSGAGMSASAKSKGTGMGRRLIQTFVKQLGASHQVESGKDGTRHRIRIPA